MDSLRNCVDPLEWAALFGASPDQPLTQSWEYGQAMTALGVRVRRFVAGQTMAQVLERRGLRLVNRGPLGPAAAVMLGRLGRYCGAVVATPEHELAGMGRIPLITPRHQALWRLDQGRAALRAGLSGKWRNRLARAEDRALRITQGGNAALEALLRHEKDQGLARGYRALPANLVAAWPGQKLVLEWRSGGAMQAGMLFLRHGSWASYHCGWVSDQGRAAFAPGPMLMKAAAMLAEQGVTTLDLGTVDAESAPGLAHFKMGTGAMVRPLGATVWVVPR